jgi:hypothetical protein
MRSIEEQRQAEREHVRRQQRELEERERNRGKAEAEPVVGSTASLLRRFGKGKQQRKK